MRQISLILLLLFGVHAKAEAGSSYYYYLYCNFDTSTPEEYRSLQVLSQLKSTGYTTESNSSEMELTGRNMREKKLGDQYGKYLIQSGNVSGKLVNCGISSWGLRADLEARRPLSGAGAGTTNQQRVIPW
jgi:hypothetical protein